MLPICKEVLVRWVFPEMSNVDQHWKHTLSFFKNTKLACIKQLAYQFGRQLSRVRVH